MFDYLQKYKSLPQELRDKISTPRVLNSIENLEKKYGVNLATVVMRVAIQDIGINDLAQYLSEDFKLSEDQSKNLAQELLKEVFYNIGDYLGIEYSEEEEEKIFNVSEGNKTPVKVDGFIFSPEDEKEILELTNKVGQYLTGSELVNEVDDKLNRVIKKVEINFGSELLSGRFGNILKTYLRGIRDRLETKQALIKPIKSGGLGFDDESAEQVLSICDQESEESDKGIRIAPPKKISVPEDVLVKEKTDKLKDIGARDLEYNLASELAKKNKDFKGEIKEEFKAPASRKTLDTTHELAPPPPAIFMPKPSYFEKAKEIKNKIIPKETRDEAVAKKLIKIEITPQRSGKIRIEDVKMQPKIMGPIDELKYMSLINFRRLDEDPINAALKIKEKIELLSEEYSKGVEGVKAWRVSPVNRLYLQMGEESIGNNKPIEVVIKERRAAGKDYLSNKEFEAVINLNRDLRF